MNFHHSGLAGDAIYALPAMLDLARRVDRRPRLLLDPRPLDWSGADRLLPLLAEQPGFDSGLYAGEPIDIDLDRFRNLPFDLSRGYLARMYTLLLPCCPDLAAPWLMIEPDERYRGSIVVNRTSRYRNPGISYRFFGRYPDLLFLGLESEYENVRTEVGSRLRWVPTADLAAAARVIAACRLFVGNQSSCFAIAEGLKVPRVLEVCPYCPNVIPHGSDGWDTLLQPHFEQVIELILEGRLP
jgi:hypothetical protein